MGDPVRAWLARGQWSFHCRRHMIARCSETRRCADPCCAEPCVASSSSEAFGRRGSSHMALLSALAQASSAALSPYMPRFTTIPAYLWLTRRYLLLAPLLGRDLRSLLRGARSLDVVSRPMAERYRRFHAGEITIVHRGLVDPVAPSPAYGRQTVIGRGSRQHVRPAANSRFSAQALGACQQAPGRAGDANGDRRSGSSAAQARPPVDARARCARAPG